MFQKCHPQKLGNLSTGMTSKGYKVYSINLSKAFKHKFVSGFVVVCLFVFKGQRKKTVKSKKPS